MKKAVLIRIPLKRYPFINAYMVANTFLGLLVDLGIDAEWVGELEIAREKARSTNGIIVVFADAQGNVQPVVVQPKSESEAMRVKKLIKAFKAMEEAFRI